jgi:hypothetical protein
MENRLLQLVKAERLPIALVPKYLNGMAAQMTHEMIHDHGGIRPDSWVVCVMLRSMHNPRAIIYFCKIIFKEQVDIFRMCMPQLSTPESMIE